MKKVILSAIAIMTIGFATAQDFKYGAKGGLDLVSVSFGGVSESLSGFFVGGFAEFGIADKFVMQPGIAYHTASKDLGGFTVKANFLSIPVLFKYEVAEKINVIAGPSLFYDLDSEVTTDKTRFNLELGGSYDITENFFVEPRYAINLNGVAKINHFLIGVGYKF
jgi:hypothetical protein